MTMAESAEERLRRHIQRTVGLRALKELRSKVDEELRADAESTRFVHAFLKYGIIFMLAASFALAYWLGVS